MLTVNSVGSYYVVGVAAGVSKAWGLVDLRLYVMAYKGEQFDGVVCQRRSNNFSGTLESIHFPSVRNLEVLHLGSKLLSGN